MFATIRTPTRVADDPNIILVGVDTSHGLESAQSSGFRLGDHREVVILVHASQLSSFSGSILGCIRPDGWDCKHELDLRGGAHFCGESTLELFQDMLLQNEKIVRSCLNGGLASSLQSSLKICARDIFRQFLMWVEQKLDKLYMLFVLINFEAPLGNF